MSRPKILHVSGTLYWVLRTYDPADGVTPIDADSVPAVAIRKNGAAVGDSVTVAKRAATTGIYDCSYNPAGEAEGDKFTVEESATISAVAYTNSWEFTVAAVERGTDGANTTAPATPTNVSDAQAAILAKLPAALIGGRMDSHVGAMAANTITAAAIAAAALNGKGDWNVGKTGYEITTAQFNALVAAIEVELLNDGTGGAVIQTIANAVAELFDDAGADLAPQVIAAAIRTELATELSRIDVATSTRSSQSSVDGLPTLPQIRTEAERVQGIRDWGVFGDAPLFEPGTGDNGTATWGSLVKIGATVYCLYSALDSGGKYILRMRSLGADGKTPTGDGWTICQGDQVYDAAGCFLPIGEVEGSTLHVVYCAMPSLFANQQVCRLSCPTSDLVSSWTKHGVIVAYNDPALPAGLHGGIEPTGWMKWSDGAYYLYVCSVPGTQRPLPSAGGTVFIDDRRAAVIRSTSITDWSAKTVSMILADPDQPSRVQPWRYLISPTAFRSSASSTAPCFLLAATHGNNTDFQRVVMFVSHNPLFQAAYTQYVGTILTVRDEGGTFPNGEIDVLSILTADINKNTFPAGDILLAFGAKNIGENWKTGLATQSSITQALRPGIQPIAERLLTSLPLRPGSTIDERDLAVKAKTDQFAFTVPNQVDANALTGGGGDPGTVAAAVRSELAVELARIDAAISSRLASAGYTVPPNSTAIQAAAIAALESIYLDKLFAAAYDPASKPGNAAGLFNIWVENDGGIPRATANFLERAPTGGGGGGADIPTIIAALAALQIRTDASGMPDYLTKGLDYIAALESAIRIDLTVSGSPFAALAGTAAASLQWKFGIGRQSLEVAGAASWVADGDGYVRVEIDGDDTVGITPGVYRWQLLASIDGITWRDMAGGTTRIIPPVAE